MIRNRSQKSVLQRRVASRLGRLVVLTGARQTGKTTLAKLSFPDTRYISVEDPATRPSWTALSATDWVKRYPRAVVDEVQKAPTLIESLKAAYDASPEVRYLLLGSSQILLLAQVKESLAGRASILELWPLTLPEMATTSWDQEAGLSRLVSWIGEACAGADVLMGIPGSAASYTRDRTNFERYLQFGGMPLLHDPELTDDERRTWLRDYRRTFLERDVRDLAAMRDLEPFVTAQEVIASRSGRIINFSDMARSAGIAPNTARRFLRYLELSYQVLQLAPYHRNPEKRLAKAPKIHFVDPGVLRSCTGRWGTPTGEEFESAVVAEIVKQVRNAGMEARFFHLRSYDGREVDLLVELEAGFVAIEIKQARRVARPDARHLRQLDDLLDRPLIGSVLLSQDDRVSNLGDGIIALPVAWALGAAGDGD